MEEGGWKVVDSLVELPSCCQVCESEGEGGAEVVLKMRRSESSAVL